MSFSPTELKKVSNHINDISCLGLELGFLRPEVERFQRENIMTSPRNSGTYAMMSQFDDRGGTKLQFIAALRRSDYGKLANSIETKHWFGQQEDEQAKGQLVLGQPTAGHQSNPNQASFPTTYDTRNNKVTQKEILDLAREIPRNEFSSLFVYLGFTLNYIDNILNQHMNSYQHASEKLLMEWSDKGNNYQFLQEALIKSGLNALAWRHIDTA